MLHGLNYTMSTGKTYGQEDTELLSVKAVM